MRSLIRGSGLVAFGVVAAVWTGTGRADAALLGYEGFDIAVGVGTQNINGSAGTGGGTAVWTSSTWVGLGGSFRCNTAPVTSGLSYGPLVTSPGQARGNVPPGDAQSTRNFGSQPASGQYWVGVILNIPNTSQFSSVGWSFFDGGNERNFVGKPGVGVFGATAGGGNSTVPTANSTAFILTLLDMSAGKQWHWVNPDISTGLEPSLASSWTGAAGANLTPFTFDRIRIGSFSDGGPSSSFDELRVGTTYADVAPIPEPAGFVAAVMLVGGALVRRRR